MSEYQKINTLFMRDENGIIIPDKFTLPEFEYLKNNIWEATEKIDGTNIRIEIDGTNIEFKGRTDKAVIPQELHDYLKTKFSPGLIFSALGYTLEEGLPENLHCTIYGEGYGRKIQTPGKRYINDGVGFILFDVKIGPWWLKRSDIEIIADKLDCKIVPIIGYYTIENAINIVKNGFKSKIAEDNTLDAEGLVLRTPGGLLFRNGQRIITKIKHGDFVKYMNKYGDDTPLQNINPHYYGD